MEQIPGTYRQKETENKSTICDWTNYLSIWNMLPRSATVFRSYFLESKCLKICLVFLYHLIPNKFYITLICLVFQVSVTTQLLTLHRHPTTVRSKLSLRFSITFFGGLRPIFILFVPYFSIGSVVSGHLQLEFDCVAIACTLESIRPGQIKVARPPMVWVRPA